MKLYAHWCLNGCGKKVIHIGLGIYECNKCKKRFNKKELKKLN